MKFYVETSAWGGYDDKEFKEWTIPFIEQAREGRFETIISDLVVKELLGAPEKIRNLPASIPKAFIKRIDIDEEQLALAQRYIKEGALTKKYESDAQHIAIATVLKVDSLASWNFRHMVNFFRIKQYNSINLKNGYSIIDIRTPKELINEEKKKRSS
jgi:hypothetical protein